MPSSSAPGAAQEEEEDGDPCGWCVGPGPGPCPGAQPMSSPPVGTRGRGLVLLTVGPPAVTAGWPGQVRQGPGGGWGAGKPQATSIACVLHHGPSANHRGSGWEAPAALAFPLVSACPIGDSLSLHLSLSPFLAMCLCLCALCFFCISSLPFLCLSSSLPSFLLCSAHLSPHAFLFLVRSPLLAISSFPSPCHLLLICQILHVAKEKKRRKKKIKTRKSRNKSKSQVCCQVLRPPGGLCVRACGPQPARLPPARLPCVLPACPPAPPADDTEFSAWVSGDGY